jgi:MFS family permease
MVDCGGGTWGIPAAATIAAMTKDQSIPVRRLWCSVLCTYLALGATLQELPGYVSGKFHVGTAAVGIAVGAAYAGTALTRPIAGRAGDSGLARRVSLIGAVITALSAIGQLLAPDMLVLVVCRVAMGAGGAAAYSGALPWVITGVPAHHRGRVSGWFGLSMWVGVSVGPLITSLVGRAGGSTPVWYVIIGLPLLSAALIATVRPQAHRPETGSLRPSAWHDLVPRGVTLPGVCLGLSAYGYGTLVALLVLYLSRDRIGGQDLGLMVFSAAFLITRAAGSPLVDSFGGARVARTVLVLEALGLLLLASLHNAPLALTSTAVTGVGLGLIYPSISAITLQRTGVLRAGVAMGTMTSFWDLGVAAAGPLSGAVAACLGYGMAFALAALVTVAAMALTWAMRETFPVCADAHGQDRGRVAV